MNKIWKHRRIISWLLIMVMICGMEFPVKATNVSDNTQSLESSENLVNQTEENNSSGDEMEKSGTSEEGEDEAEEPGTPEEGKDGAEEPGTSEEGKDGTEEPGISEEGIEEPETENTGNVDTTPVISEDTASLLAEFIEMLATLPTADGSLNQEEFDQVLVAYNKYSAVYAAFMTDNGDGSFDFDEYLLSTYEGTVENFYALLATPMTTDEPTEADVSEHDGLVGVTVDGKEKGTIVETAKENIEVHLFNYGLAINPEYVWKSNCSNRDDDNVLLFAATDARSLDDVTASLIGSNAVMANSLKDGYPEVLYYDAETIESYGDKQKRRRGSLKYLFDKNTDFVDATGTNHEGVVYDPISGEYTGELNDNVKNYTNEDRSKYQSQHYKVENNDGSGNGLFIKDDAGYLVFDSSDNFAWYNKVDKKFELYNFALRPYGGGVGNRARGHFLPFNSVLTNTYQLSNNEGPDYILDSIATKNADGIWNPTEAYKKLGTDPAGLYEKETFALNSIKNDYTTDTQGAKYFRPNVWVLPNANLQEQRAECADYWYGMSVEFDFYMPANGKVLNEKTEEYEDMVFEFLGDDDVWVYIDDRLVLDMTKSNGETVGKINFATGEITNSLKQQTYTDTNNTITMPQRTTIKQCFTENGEIVNDTEFVEVELENDEKGFRFVNNTPHKLKFFYLERGGGSCNCRLKFNIPTLPPNSLTVTKELTSNESTEVKEYIEASVPYKFRVLKVDDTGKATNELFIPGNTPFKILEGGKEVGTGITDEETGEFIIKANQSALFEKMLEIGAGKTKYIVEEILDNAIRGQYAGVEYVVNGAGGETEAGGSAEQFSTYQSNVVDTDSDDTQLVSFKNKVDTSKLSTLKIKKQVEAGSNLPDDQTFRMQVTLGGKLLPAGTKYKVGKTEYEVGSDGCVSIKAGETAEILSGILSGTEYQVQELDTEANKYRTTYEGTETIGGKDLSTLTFENPAQAADGTVKLNSSVEIVVHNATYDFAGEIPITKQYLGNTSTKAFQFDIVQVKADGTPLEGAAQLPGTSITVKDADETSGKIVVGYDNTTQNRSYYYKITEKIVDADRKTLLYDESSYIVEIEVSGDTTKTATVKTIKRNGENYSGKSVKFVNRKMIPVTISKTVSGNLGDQSKAFPFSLSITVDGNKYIKQLDYYQNSGSGTINHINETYAFNLAHGQSIRILLPYGCNYILSENMKAEWNYDSTTFVIDGVEQKKNNLSVSKENLTADQTISVTNHKEEIPDTGISLDSMPYILVLALAVIGVAIFIIFKRKRRDDD